MTNQSTTTNNTHNLNTTEEAKMTQLDRIISGVDAIEDGLTLKADYTEEKRRLDNICGDLSVMATMGAPRWKVNDAKQRICRIKEWMIEEEVAALR